MKSIEELRLMCRIDEITGCWHWTGATKENHKGRKTPAVWVFCPRRGAYRMMTGPIGVLTLSGRWTPQMERGWRACLCDDCMNPAHMMGGTVRDWGSFVRATGRWKNQAARIAAGRQVGRSQSALTPELVAKVKAAPTGREGARLAGITESHASKIRRGRIWANRPQPGASVFTLGAR